MQRAKRYFFPMALLIAMLVIPFTFSIVNDGKVIRRSDVKERADTSTELLRAYKQSIRPDSAK